jgi:transposase
MAAKRKDIMDIRQILQLKTKGLSNRKVATILGISRNTINEYISFLKSLDKGYADLLELDDGALEALFPRQDHTDMARYEALQSKFDYYRKELTKVGCTLQHLWYEYKAAHPEGYGYTQFVSHYRKWCTSKVVSGILEHKAGNQLFMDYTGKLLHYIDKNTGEQISAEVFVCILPCSKYTYVQAVASQRKEDFIAGVNGCLQYLGGVPQALVSDNLKRGVTKAHNYAPKINKTFKDCGLHYNIVIDPARPLKPQDKGLVENAVRWVYQRIFYTLSKQTFFSLEQLNEAILPLLEKYNGALLKNRDVSRRQLFVELEQSVLQPLPAQPYILRYYKRAKVQKISHIFHSDDKCYYSVPYTHMQTSRSPIQQTHRRDLLRPYPISHSSKISRQGALHHRHEAYALIPPSL